MVKLSHFLNLDLVLKSNSDFSVLIGYLDQSVFVLQHQEHEQQFMLPWRPTARIPPISQPARSNSLR